VIGLANIYKQTRYNFSNPMDLKPQGDLPGVYWGAFRVSWVFDYTKPPDNSNNWANSYLFTIEVDGIVVFQHRHIQRNWWRPRQLYQNAFWNGSSWSNFNWSQSFSNDTTANPAGGLIGAFTGGNGAPLRSYQDAFFEPQAQGPAANPMGFGVGNVPTRPTRWFWCNCEPVFFTATVLPGQTFVLRSRRFVEIPNPALNPPINDTQPQAGQAAEPDEIETEQIDGTWGNTPRNLECWVIRVGPAVETFQEIATIAPNPGEIDL
jgi:hypothetical protein